MVGGVKLKLKLNSAQLKLEFGLSLATEDREQMVPFLDCKFNSDKNTANLP